MITVAAELDWTQGRVQVQRFDDGEQRTVLVDAGAGLNHEEHPLVVEAVCLEELDELIEALQAQRAFLEGR